MPVRFPSRKPATGYGAQQEDTMTKIWANSADSHVLEPADLWLQALPPRLAERAPRSERGDKYEVLYIDGERVDRQLNDFMDKMRPPGARDLGIRLQDL